MSSLILNIARRIIPLNREQVRWLPRWSHRRPVQVIAPDEYDETKDTRIKKSVPEYEDFSDAEPAADEPRQARTSRESSPRSFKGSGKPINIKKYEDILDGEPAGDESRQEFSPRSFKGSGKPINKKIISRNVKPLTISKSKVAQTATVDMLETVIDNEGNFIYTKMKNNDSRISTIMVDVKSKKEKTKKDLILLEGKRLIKDALDSGCKLDYILFSRIKEVEYLRPSLPKFGVKLFKMPYREMQLWSDLTTNPGIMGLFKVPDRQAYLPPEDTIPLTVICDNIREPNNLGAILRTCSGVGCTEIILTKGCVNVWETKVLRSAAGAHFKLEIKKKSTWEDVKGNIQKNAKIYIADHHEIVTSDSNSSPQSLAELVQAVPILPYYGVNFRTSDHIVLIIGGETEGISEESYRLAADFGGARLNIPLSNGVDSLNAGTALGIIVFEMKRQLNKVE